MRMTLKEIAIDHWRESRDLLKEIRITLLEILTEHIPEIFTDFYIEFMLDTTHCLNVVGKTLVWLTLGILIGLFCLLLICVMIFIVCVLIFLHILMIVLIVVFFLPSIPWKWFYQRVLGPLFRFLFRKKTPECRGDF